MIAAVELRIKGHPYLFAVDTGAAQTVVDTTVAKALALPDHGPASHANGVGCKIATQPVTISDWKLGGVTLPATTALSAKTQFSGSKTSGILYGGQLGSEVLSRFGRMTLDFAGKRLILAGQPPSGGKALPAQVLRKEGEVLATVQATLHGRRVGFILDTGASRTIINARTTQQLGLQAVGQSHKIISLGCLTTITPVRVDDWTAGGVKLPATVAFGQLGGSIDRAKSKANVVGLLGAEVMSTFGEVTIDFAAKRVVLGGIAAH